MRLIMTLPLGTTNGASCYLADARDRRCDAASLNIAALMQGYLNSKLIRGAVGSMQGCLPR